MNYRRNPMAFFAVPFLLLSPFLGVFAGIKLPWYLEVCIVVAIFFLYARGYICDFEFEDGAIVLGCFLFLATALFTDFVLLTTCPDCVHVVEFKDALSNFFTAERFGPKKIK